MRRIGILALLASAVLGAAAQGAESGKPIAVDLALVIAVDVSRSMDAEEFRLQRDGYVAAIRDPDFVAAAMSGGERRIALTYVEWSGQIAQKIVVPWRLIDGADAAEAFAAALEGEPPESGRGTSISGAITFSAVLLEANRYAASRRAIDVSGDGPNNYGQPVTRARDNAVARGIVVNGLPILIRPSPIVPDIVRYYSDCVIGGPGAFVLPVRKAEEFADAIRRKLILEVAGAPAAQLFLAAAGTSADCLVGERARRRYSDPYFPGLDR